MKRYLLFSGDLYYPSGGADDFVGDFDTLQEVEDHMFLHHTKDRAKDFIHPTDWAWLNVLDIVTGTVLTRYKVEMIEGAIKGPWAKIIWGDPEDPES